MIELLACKQEFQFIKQEIKHLLFAPQLHPNTSSSSMQRESKVAIKIDPSIQFDGKASVETMN